MSLPRSNLHQLRRHLQKQLSEERLATDSGIARSPCEALQLAEDEKVTSPSRPRHPKLTGPDGTKVEFPMKPLAKHCLLEGIDELGYILQHEKAISPASTTKVRDPKRQARKFNAGRR